MNTNIINDNSDNKKAFSLIELSIVLVVIGVLSTAIAISGHLIDKSEVLKARNLTKNAPVESVKNLSLWFDSTTEDVFNDGGIIEDGLNISSWNGVSTSSSLQAVQATSGSQPSYVKNGINGLPSVLFDEANSEYIELSKVISGGKFTLVFVSQTFDSNASGAILSFSNTSDVTDSAIGGARIFDYNGFFRVTRGNAGGSSSMLKYHNAVNVGHISILNLDNGVLSYYLDGSNTPTVSTNSAIIEDFNFERVLFGAGWSSSSVTSFFGGYIGEVIIYRNTLTTSERDYIEEYLSKKWGVTLVP